MIIKIVTTVMAAVILIGFGSLFVASALEGIGLVVGSVVLAGFAVKAVVSLNDRYDLASINWGEGCLTCLTILFVIFIYCMLVSS